MVIVCVYETLNLVRVPFRGLRIDTGLEFGAFGA